MRTWRGTSNAAIQVLRVVLLGQGPALETRHKPALKAVAHKANNQASVGGSVLRANMQLEASEDLARHVDRTGLHLIHTLWTLCTHCARLCTLFHLGCSKCGRGAQCAQSSFEIRVKCEEFAPGVLIAGNCFPRKQCAHRVHTVSHLVHIFDTLCAYGAHFDHFRAKGVLMNAY